MSYPTYVPSIGGTLAEGIDNEIEKAEKKFGSQPLETLLHALNEEVGEVAKARLEDPTSMGTELVQVAAMAIRCYKEWLQLLDSGALPKPLI